MRAPRREGARPNKIPTAKVTPTVNSSTRQSGAISKGKASYPLEKSTTIALIPHRDRKIPSAPPTRESSKLSVSNCRIMRARPAPSARRTAISL